MENKINKFLEELIQEIETELDEATASGAAGAYSTPSAFSDNGSKDKNKKKKIATQLGMKLVGKVNERINPKFYDARVQYIDPKSKKKFVGDVVRYDNGQYKVNLGKDGRFERYILAKEKDLKIVSKSKKRTYESVNEGKYNYKADALTAYFKGKIDAKELDKIARDDFKSGIATKKELSNFLSNKFTQDVMSDTYGIPTGTLIKRVRGLMKFAESIGESVNEAKVKRPVNRWLELKNDESMHPHKKMAMGLKELKHQLAETQKFFNWYNKIKTMNELDSNQYWKRTNKHIYKIKERLVNIARTIQEIEK